MTNRNSSLYGGQKRGNHPESEAKPPIRAVPHFFLKFFPFFPVFQVKSNFFANNRHTVAYRKIFISNPRNNFYTLLQNLNKNGQKRTRKINFGYKFGPYSKRPMSTILKWIKNTHSDTFTMNTEPLTRTKD